MGAHESSNTFGSSAAMQRHLNMQVPGSKCVVPGARRLGAPRAVPCVLARSSVQGGFQPAAVPEAAADIDYKKIASASLVAVLVCTIASGPAHAHTSAERVWKPRRHHRRMGERISDTWAEEAVEAEQTILEARVVESQRSKRLRLQQEEEAFQRMKKEQEERVQRAEKMITKVDAYGARLPFSVKLGGVELFPYLFWGTVATFVLWASRSILQRAQGQKKEGGKWVYDRSLGGKKVWVPDATAAGAATTVSPAVRAEEFDRLVSVATSARQKLDQGSKEFSLPAWWNLPPTSFASPDERAAKQVEADNLLARIEQAKNRGEDYSIGDILALRAICQEGGVSVQPKTVGARDAIYQAAIDEAVAFAQDHTNTEHGVGDQGCECAETRLLTGLAGDIGLAEERAVGMVKKAVAATCRARLLDALKYLKEGNELDALVALMHLTSLTENLPVMSVGSVEPDLIASSLRDTSSLEERQKIFYIVGQLDMQDAALFAEMLGFDPALVVPKLVAEVSAVQKEKASA